MPIAENRAAGIELPDRAGRTFGQDTETRQLAAIGHFHAEITIERRAARRQEANIRSTTVASMRTQSGYRRFGHHHYR